MKLIQTNSTTSLFEINITPFVDILLVLLVIVLITAPFIATSITVKLPTANGIRTMQSRRLVISLSRANRITIKKKHYTRTKAINYIKRWKQLHSNGAILVEADKRTQYGKVIALFNTLRESHIEKVNLLVNKPELQ